MKNSIKLAVLAAALGVAASTQAYTSRDLLVGFTDGTTDHIYDIGGASGLFQGETWNLGSYFGTANLGTQFGVIGSTTALAQGQYVWVTSSDPAQNGFVQVNQWSTAKANVATAGQTLTVNSGRTTTASDTTGWFYQTAEPAGTPNNSFQNNYYNPNVAVGSVAYFFQNLPNVPTADSFFTYNAATGILTFGTAVPEPATYGVLAGFGVLLLSVRRQFAKA